ncbi:hypothetical protein M404DRAFT_23794 [Pisolithus tinctorius Marx 270]|uniref:Uncharacterized protein n=1 Tax=Pisolithus tinctorius Marx 270 TaxID=870435 RepID=A0A0C3PH44_PISTI|nr:hypothetical protein M404DRAFT_23794 [Pisolithus tinctorius Marx 270]
MTRSRSYSPNHGSRSPDFNDDASIILGNKSAADSGDAAEDSDSDSGCLKWSGAGQGAPLDHNGCYIYSLEGPYWQLDEARFAEPLPSPDNSEVSAAAEGDKGNSELIEAVTKSGASPPMGMKRKLSDAIYAPRVSSFTVMIEDEDVQPYNFPKASTPLGGSVTNAGRAKSVPSSPPQKRRRLASPFELSSSMQQANIMGIKGAIEEAGNEIAEALVKQNAILLDILRAIRYRKTL